LELIQSRSIEIDVNIDISVLEGDKDLEFKKELGGAIDPTGKKLKIQHLTITSPQNDLIQFECSGVLLKEAVDDILDILEKYGMTKDP
jgi:hypothetical protein